MHMIHLSSEILEIFCSRLIALHGRKEQLKNIYSLIQFEVKMQYITFISSNKGSKILVDCCDFQFLTMPVYFFLKEGQREGE